MTLEQRQAQLREEVANLVNHIVSLHAACPSGKIDNPFLQHLEQLCREKTRELDALNTLLASPRYRFWAVSRAILWLIWISAAMLLVCTVAMSAALGPGYQIFFGCLTLMTAGWALWASITPKV